MVPRKRWSPVRQYLDEPAAVQMLTNRVLVKIRDTIAIQGSDHGLGNGVERDLSVHTNPQLLTILFKFPRVKPP